MVLAALPYGAGAAVVDGLRAALTGKVLLDCANPVGPGFRLLTGGGPSAAGRLAAAAPGAQIVKAFNLCHEDVWRMTPPVFDGRPLAVPVCGDDGAALTLVYELVRDVGCEPVAGAGWNAPGCWRRPRHCSSDCGRGSRRTHRRSHRHWRTRRARKPSVREAYRTGSRCSGTRCSGTRLFRRQVPGARCSVARRSNTCGHVLCWHEPGWDGAGRIRTGVLLHAVKARQPLRYEPHPARDHTSHPHPALWNASPRTDRSARPSKLVGSRTVLPACSVVSRLAERTLIGGPPLA